MANNKKISQLGLAGTLDGTELVPVVKAGVTVQTTTQDIADLGGASSTQLISPDGNTTISAFDAQANIGVTDGLNQTASSIVQSDSIVNEIADGTNTMTISQTPTTFTKNGVEVATVNDLPTIDTTIVDGSTNPVDGNAVFDALALKANIASPTFTGTPLAPTPTLTLTSTEIINAAFFNAKVPFVTLEQFGAVGNGATNDAAALVLAIASNKPIYLMAKTYLINTSVSTGSNCCIIGCGERSILKTTANITLLSITGSKNTFVNFTMEGNSTGGSQNGMFADGTASFFPYYDNKVSNCTFRNFGTAGLAFRQIIGSSSSTYHQGAFTVTNSFFYGNVVGILALVQGEYSSFTNCSVYLNTVGVRFQGGNNSFTGGQVIDNTSGVEITSGTNDAHCSFTGVKINHNTTNITCTHGLGYIFSACSIYAGGITCTGTGKTLFNSCLISMSSATLTITNSPVTYSNCEMVVVPSTYTLTGTAPVLNNCYLGTAKMASPTVSYNELNTLAANGTFTVPAGMTIESIVYENTTANAVTGGVRFGTTNGGAEVVTAQAIGANAVGQITDANILLRFFSSTAQQILYIQAVTAWNSASVKFYIKLKPLI